MQAETYQEGQRWPVTTCIVGIISLASGFECFDSCSRQQTFISHFKKKKKKKTQLNGQLEGTKAANTSAKDKKRLGQLHTSCAKIVEAAEIVAFPSSSPSIPFPNPCLLTALYKTAIISLSPPPFLSPSLPLHRPFPYYKKLCCALLSYELVFTS